MRNVRVRLPFGPRCVFHRRESRWLAGGPTGHPATMDAWHPQVASPTDLVTPVRRDPDGLTGPTRGAAAGSRWRRTSQGLHVPAEVAQTVEQRITEVAARLPVNGRVTGWGALRLAGVAYCDGLARDGITMRPVPVLLPHASRIKTPGVLVERTRRPLGDPEIRYDVPCAPLHDALLHELSRAQSRRDAAVMIDMVLAARVTTLEEVVTWLASVRRVPATAAWAINRACPDCRSPRESEMLVTWQDGAGFERPLMNREVLNLSGRRLAVVDLLDVEAGVVGEYNGAAHRDRERLRRDEERLAALRDVGLETFTIVAGDSRAVQLDRMRGARRRALWRPDEQRQWRVGRTILAEPLKTDSPDEDRAAFDEMMRQHHASYD